MSPPLGGALVPLIELGVGVLALVAAGVLLRLGPRRAVNQNLATVLVLEALAAIGIAGIWLNGSDDQSVFPVVFMAGASALPWFYLRFLSVLETPLTTWLRRPRVQTALVAAATLGWIALAGLLAYALSLGSLDAEPAWWDRLFFVLFVPPVIVVPLFALAASVSAWRRARSDSLERSRARAMALAFGLRDAIYAFIGVMLLLGVVVDVWIPREWPASLADLFPVATVLYLPLLVYGILKTQLFDIDLKVRKGLRVTILSAFFVGVLTVVSELVEALVSTRADWLVGLGTATLLTFGVRPVERAATRLAHRLTPGGDASPEAIEQRKREVYRLAVDDVWRDGRVEPSERGRLTRLGADLGLEPSTMAAIEAALAGGPQAVEGSPPADAGARSEGSVRA